MRTLKGSRKEGAKIVHTISYGYIVYDYTFKKSERVLSFNCATLKDAELKYNLILKQ